MEDNKTNMDEDTEKDVSTLDKDIPSETPEPAVEKSQSLKEKIDNKLNLTPEQRKAFSVSALLGVVILALFLITIGVKNLKTNVQESSQIPTSTDKPATKSETDDWKIYTNNNLGIRFKYPKKFSLDIDTNDNATFTVDAELGGKVTRIEVYRGRKYNVDTLDFCPAHGGIIPCQQTFGESPREIGTIEVAGRKANNFNVYDYDKSKSQTLYRIVQFENSDVELKLLDSNGFNRIYDQILSTFQFIDPSEASAKEGEFIQPGKLLNPNAPELSQNVANWTTSNSANNTFSVKHPKELTVKAEKDLIDLDFIGSSQISAAEFFDGISMTIQILTFDGKSLEQVALDDKQNLVEGIEPLVGDRVSEITNVTIGNLNGKKFVSDAHGHSEFYYFPVNNDKYVRFGDGSIDPDNKGYKDIAEKIISTFKYLE